MYSLHAHHFVKNVMGLQKVNINSSDTNNGCRILYWEVHTYYEVWILKTKRCSTRKVWSGETFCGVCP